MKILWHVIHQDGNIQMLLRSYEVHIVHFTYLALENMAAASGCPGGWQYAQISPHGITERKRMAA